MLIFTRDVREAVHAEYGLVPAWEQKEIAEAEVYAQSNWLLASQAALQKALYVTQLPDEEYWGGDTYTDHDATRSPRRAHET